MTPKVSADSLRTKLRVISRAQDDAADELPDSGATELGASETAIVSHCLELLAGVENDARRDIKRIVDSLPAPPTDAGVIANSQQALGAAVDSAIAEMSYEIADASAHLQRIRSDYS